MEHILSTLLFEIEDYESEVRRCNSKIKEFIQLADDMISNYPELKNDAQFKGAINNIYGKVIPELAGKRDYYQTKLDMTKLEACKLI